MVFWLMAGTFPAAEFGEDTLPAGIMIFLTYAGGLWIVAMTYFFMAILVIDLVRLADKVFGFIPAKAKETVLTLGLSVVSYGMWNARHPRVTEYDLTVNKKANGLDRMRIVMVSDLHPGDK
jgi:hypothetical protein